MTTSPKPSHFGHRARLRKRVETAGIASFLDHEFLELLLTYSITRKDTKSIAWQLLKQFGSLSAVLDADEAALSKVPGVGPRTIQLLTLVREAFSRYTKDKLPRTIKVGTVNDILDYCRYSLAGKHEEFVEVMFLSNGWKLLKTHRFIEGAISEIRLEPRKVVEMALHIKATGLIVIHNHPSGDPRPSAADLAWTNQLEQAAGVFDISVWEHLIICRHAHFSFHGHQLVHPKETMPES